MRLQDPRGRPFAARRVPEGLDGVALAHELAAGYQVYAINPLSVSRYRDRRTVSGAKSGPGDAKLLADVVRTDRHNHRPIAVDSDLPAALSVGPQPQNLIRTRQRQTDQLRSALREHCPGALVAFDDLDHPTLWPYSPKRPHPSWAGACPPLEIAAALRRRPPTQHRPASR